MTNDDRFPAGWDEKSVQRVLGYYERQSDAKMFYTSIEEDFMPTSKKVASQAGKDLRDPMTPKRDRAPIAAALAEAKRTKKRYASKRTTKR